MVWEDPRRPRLPGGVLIGDVEVGGPWRLETGNLYVMQRAVWHVPMRRLLGWEIGMFRMLLSEAQGPSATYHMGMLSCPFIVRVALTYLFE